MLTKNFVFYACVVAVIMIVAVVQPADSLPLHSRSLDHKNNHYKRDVNVDSLFSEPVMTGVSDAAVSKKRHASLQLLMKQRKLKHESRGSRISGPGNGLVA
jgi:hypothetical protein